MKYKSFTLRGDLRYQQGTFNQETSKYRWRMVSKQVVPVDILDRVNGGEVVSTEDVVQLTQPKECIFCGEPAKLSRLVNVQTVYLCDKHYYSESLGKVAQKLREITEEREKALHV